MRKWWSGRSAVLVVLVGVACGESRDDEARTPYQEFMSEYAQAFCEALGPCCTAFEFSADRCAALMRWGAVAEAGAARDDRFVFHPDRAEQCLVDIRAQGVCGGSEPASCRSVTEGTLAGGEACQASPECISTPRSAGFCNAGVCQAPPRTLARGEACSATCSAEIECFGYDAYCYTDTGLTCRDGVCQDLAPLGASCSGFDSCVAGTSCEAGTCVAQGGPGSACTDSDQCTNGNYCASGVCTAQVPAGSPCSGLAFDECGNGFCSDGRCADLLLETLCGFGAL